ncbi:LCCL domain-containing protein [Massariosphaeria phaeospora]|uniref:LCCL domain-containing protein n=1 Tax=Massariosphaeria phaeospora TaxID=100035 RepID=A0A7C8MJ04_9PLEO|nr:LCCL domain-containing protein [Massariosphaeria phaeospora]
MPPNDPQELRADEDYDTIAGGETDIDEEAQLLPVEELEFEDNIGTHPTIKPPHRRIQHWLRGPQPPHVHAIRPFFSQAQKSPVKLVDRFLPKTVHKTAALVALFLLWLFVFSFCLRSELPIKDESGKSVVNLDCTDTVWRPRNDCGIDGINCRPFSNTSFGFRCPANCAAVQVLNPRAVGPLDIVYQPFVVGGDVYRGDSFICGSAIHAGVVSNGRGGCGQVSLAGENVNFLSSRKHGIESIPFDSYFPLSFSFSTESAFRCSNDPRQTLLIVSLFFTTVLSIFSTSTLQFFPIFALIFVHVSFASDPPTASYRNVSVIPDHISMFVKRFLPACFCAVILYMVAIKRTLSDLTAQFEKTILWLGGFWFGALSNYTFDWIPISRLTAHDLEQQPGAKIALAIIIIILVAIVAGQAYSFWFEGRLIRYLALYGLFIFSILFSLLIPGVSLRIHHYVLALLLLPGTSMQTRPSLIYQGILLGLFVNGIARWDFDSILQTSNDLRADGKFDSVIPTIAAPAISFSTEDLIATFQWDTPPGGVDGISVLVNDVERDRAFWADGVDGLLTDFQWRRPIGMELREYLRFAYVRESRTLDYTKPGTLFANGTWTMDS